MGGGMSNRFIRLLGWFAVGIAGMERSTLMTS